MAKKSQEEYQKSLAKPFKKTELHHATLAPNKQ